MNLLSPLIKTTQLVGKTFQLVEDFLDFREAANNPSYKDGNQPSEFVIELAQRLEELFEEVPTGEPLTITLMKEYDSDDEPDLDEVRLH